MRPSRYYTSLVMSQYQTSPRFLAWIRSNALTMLDVAACADLMMYHFGLLPSSLSMGISTDLDETLTTDRDTPLAVIQYARGVQLDTLGIIIGQGRTVDFEPTDGSSPTLDDDTYRLLLQAKIGLNHWDGRIEGLKDLWHRLFPQGRTSVEDNLDMSMNVFLWGGFSPIIKDLIANGYIIPRPQGVKINYFYGITPFFGCDRDDEYIAGVDTGHAV
jgi:hypothetical protein